jgi:hypothetical protein
VGSVNRSLGGRQYARHVCPVVPRLGRHHGYKDMLDGREGMPLRQVFPDLAQGMIEQTNELARVLAERGVVVHRPRPLLDTEIAADSIGLMNQFARDPQVVIGKHVIETNLRMVFRNKEHLGYDQLWPARLAEDPDARHVRMPEATAVLPRTQIRGGVLEPAPQRVRRAHAQNVGHRHRRPAAPPRHLCQTSGDSVRLAQALHGKGVKPLT